MSGVSVRGYLAVPLLTSEVSARLVLDKYTLKVPLAALPWVCGKTPVIPETLGVLGQAGDLFPFTCFSYKHG